MHSLEDKLDALPISVEYPCAYLKGRMARQQAFSWPDFEAPAPGAFYQELMNARFRRSGRLFYRPACETCALCVPLRMEVGAFSPTESQRKVLKRNLDVNVTWGAPEMNAEKVALYARYTAERHDKEDEARDVASELHQFLYDSPTETIEAVYRVEGKIIAVGICDLTPDILSSVYVYFEPEQKKRSLGVFTALEEMRFARDSARPYYYLGYWIEGCSKMEYKASFGAHERLENGRWIRHPRRL
jgi:leucyl-tRNA---protein transferase